MSAAFLLACAPAAAADDPVIARSGSVSITVGGLRDLVKTLPEQNRLHVAADPTALAELLRAAVLQAMLSATAHKAGYDRQPMVAAEAERARQTVIVRRFVESQLAPVAPPSEAAIAAAYAANKNRFMLPRQYHVAQIFAALPPGASPAQIERVRQRLSTLRAALGGKSDEFAASARAASDDKRSAAHGGDLGWVREDSLAEPIKGAVAGMQEGAISEPLRTPDGWHLIALIATRPAAPAALDQVRPALVAALTQQQRAAQTQAYLDGVLARSPVQLDGIKIAQIAEQSGAGK